MLHKTVVIVQVQAGVAVESHFEQVVDSEEEAREFGHSVALRMNAFMEGFGEADLSE